MNPRSLPRLAWTLAAGAGLLRLPFAAQRLWDHDSVQFALGVEAFDLAAHHPHPPGYPVYIAALKALDWLGVEPLHGMVALSILGGMVGTGLMVLLTARLLGWEPEMPGQGVLGEPALGGGWSREPVSGPAPPFAGGLLAGLLYATSPLLWFYGELPLVYAVEGGLSVAVAYGAVTMGASRRHFVAASVVFALAAGIRPSTGVLLAPLFLGGVAWARWRGRASLRRIVIGGVVGLAVVAAWLLPLLAAAGGLEEYRHISSGLFGTLLPQTSVLYGAGSEALLHNLEILVKWCGQALVPALPAALLVLWATHRARRARRRGEYDDRPLTWGVQALLHASPWLFLWIVPPVLFFLLFHITKAGYTFVFLPGLLVSAAVVCAPGLAGVGGRRLVLTGAGASSGWRRTWVAALLSVLAGAGIFLWAPDRRPDQPRVLAFVLHEFHPETIRDYERELDATLEIVRQRDAAATLLLTLELAGSGGAAAEGYLYPWHRHLQWYAPDYPLVMLAPDEELSLRLRGHRPLVAGGEEVIVPAGIRRVLWVLAGLPGERLRLPPAEVLYRGQWMTVLEGPFRGEMVVGPFHLVQEASEAAPPVVQEPAQSSQEPVEGSSEGGSPGPSSESVGGRK